MKGRRRRRRWNVLRTRAAFWELDLEKRAGLVAERKMFYSLSETDGRTRRSDTIHSRERLKFFRQQQKDSAPFLFLLKENRRIAEKGFAPSDIVILIS